MALFQRGDGGNKGGGRRQGARNRISTALLTAFAEDFEKFGEETVRITRVEKPVEYLRIAASLLPKEFEITHSQQLHELSDEELEQFIEQLKLELHRSTVIDVTVGAEPAPYREQVRLLQSLPSTT